MTRKVMILAVLIGVICLSSSAFAQCDHCENPGDFCYTDSLFNEMCASFTVESGTFMLYSGKKDKQIPLPDSTLNTSYLLKISDNRKLKLDIPEILFIQQAIPAWEFAKRDIGIVYYEDSLGIKVLTEGDGAMPEVGQTVTVHYEGSLSDGTIFDSSFERNTPFSFQLGAGRVIKGWDEALQKIPVGSRALIKIPAKLGYGARGAGGVIPPNATLYFEVEVIKAE